MFCSAGIGIFGGLRGFCRVLLCVYLFLLGNGCILGFGIQYRFGFLVFLSARFSLIMYKATKLHTLIY